MDRVLALCFSLKLVSTLVFKYPGRVFFWSFKDSRDYMLHYTFLAFGSFCLTLPCPGVCLLDLVAHILEVKVVPIVLPLHVNTKFFQLLSQAYKFALQ